MLSKEQIKNLTSIVLDYVLELDDKSVDALISKNAKIGIIDNVGSVPKEVVIAVEDDNKVEVIKKKAIVKSKEIQADIANIEYIARKLDKVRSKKEARELLENKKITKKMLRDVADNLGLCIPVRYTKEKIIVRLIDETIGLKLKMKKHK